MHRERSFGEEHLSFLDRMIFWIRARKLKHYLPASLEMVVELGSGYRGALLQDLLRSGTVKRAHGVDLSVDERLHIPALSLETGDLNDARVSLLDGSAQAVLSLAVIEHLHDQRHVFEEAFRLLAPGGTFILTTPSPLAKPILEFMAYRLHIIDEREIRDHKHYFTKKELQELFREVGFRSVTVKHFLFGLNTIAVGVRP